MNLSQPDAAMVIGELMRMLHGRHEMYAHQSAVDWLTDHGYCYKLKPQVNVHALSAKGEAFAESIIRKSGIVAMLDEDFEI